MPKTAVILFPGTNCELEMLQACRRAHLNPELFRWNEPVEKLKNYDAIILPGGFSYEDRGRSGMIAAKDPLMATVKAEAAKGKPVLGVCNGAQILVEAGMIPGLHPDHLDMALAWNERIQKGKIVGLGYYNDWIYMRSDVRKNRSPFNRFSSKTIMCVPVAHGEGRFTTRDSNVLKTLIRNEQTLFRYCDEQGKIKSGFPVNTNNAIYNLAGVCNDEGNVLALMPHPERTLSGQPLYDSLADYLKSKRSVRIEKFSKNSRRTLRDFTRNSDDREDRIEKMAVRPDLMITVRTIITDNEERTLENTLKKNGFPEVALERQIYYGIFTKDQKNPKKLAETLMKSGELLNLNKEIPTIIIGSKSYGYEKEKGLIEQPKKENEKSEFIVTDYDNYQGKNIQSKLKKYFVKSPILKVERGIHWRVKLKKTEPIEMLIRSHIFHNPHSMKLVEIHGIDLKK